MKVLGLCGGRKLGNSEILVKEALMAAEEAGAAVEIIRLMDLNIKPALGDGERQVTDDDAKFLNNKIVESNGLILGCPVYSLTAPGISMLMRDRVSIRHAAVPRPQVAALIAVGGTDWVSLALPTMYLFLPQGQVKLVDQLLVTHTSYRGIVVLDKETVARAHRLGINVAKAINMPPDQVKYLGDEYAACPICQQNLLRIRGSSVECPICDVRGKLEIKGDTIKVIFTEEDLKTYRWGSQGLERHSKILKTVNTVDPVKKAEIKEQVKKYADYKSYSSPPRVASSAKPAI
jgi:multimeric flavodoxin WrbA